MKQGFWSVFTVVFLIFGVLAPVDAQAQERVWLQVEAQPSLRAAQERARAYAGVFGDVSGFQLSSGWYAIVLGPVDPLDAEGRLADLRGLRQIPGDSFVAGGTNFRQQFWPIGPGETASFGSVAAAVEPATEPAVEPQPEATDVIELAATPSVPSAEQPPSPEIIVLPDPEVLPEETLAEARRSEADLSREERDYLQTAMQWQGFYAAAIDGDFGPGTRNAMAAWQEAQGLTPTGVLTTIQRADLVAAYRADLASLGLETVRDEAAGIEMQLPTALVAFDHYDPPFVHFSARSGSGVTVLLISQAGDQNTLFGLFDIMQTLEIVPPNGMRERKEQSFVLTGQSAALNSYTYAELRGGLVKGYTLAWNPRDEARMARVLAAMQTSFAPFGERAMDDSVSAPTEDQRRDMLAGLEVRRPAFSRSGFYIDAGGSVLTSVEAVAQCARVTLDETTDAEIAFQDPALGIAVLRPLVPLSPPQFGRFQSATLRLNAEVAVAGFSYEDAIELPTVTFGTLADLRGLDGETGVRRLAISVLPGDVGGPVLDSSGAVLGMLLPRLITAGRVLPEDVNFLTSAQVVSAAVAAAGTVVSPSTQQGSMPPEDLTALAMNMTVLVSCWK